MKLGYVKDLVIEDLWSLKPSDKASVNADHFQINWQKEIKKQRPSLVRALYQTYGFMFSTAAIYKAIQDLLAFLQPQFLRGKQQDSYF